MQQKFENELLNEILLYINENIYSPLNVEDLCDHFAISRSSLQSLFRNYVYTAPKEYISNLKLEKSKVLIKESKYTISEISSILGFSSIHYFSRRFKQRFGMNPTDYANKFIDWSGFQAFEKWRPHASSWKFPLFSVISDRTVWHLPWSLQSHTSAYNNRSATVVWKDPPLRPWLSPCQDSDYR